MNGLCVAWSSAISSPSSIVSSSVNALLDLTYLRLIAMAMCRYAATLILWPNPISVARYKCFFIRSVVHCLPSIPGAYM